MGPKERSIDLEKIVALYIASKGATGIAKQAKIGKSRVYTDVNSKSSFKRPLSKLLTAQIRVLFS